MSVTKDIFIKSNSSLGELAQELEKVTGVEFEFILDDMDDGKLDRYQWNREGIYAFLIRAFDFVNDKSLNFEDYQYYIGIEGPAQEEYARMVFEKLKSTEQYSLMLVHDVQVELDEYEPYPNHEVSS
jgi:predicted nuclease of restriction endonuclease-like RecB superfamily